MAAQTGVNSIIGQSGRYEATTELKRVGGPPTSLHDGSPEVVGMFPESKRAAKGGSSSLEPSECIRRL